jgi:uncharacterized protein YPO0396
LDGDVSRLAAELQPLRGRQSGVQEAQRVADFGDIDHATHERDIQSLNLEREALEQQSDTLRLLKKQLAVSETRQAALQSDRDELVGTVRELERAIAEGKRLIANAVHSLQAAKADGLLELHRHAFGDLEGCFTENPLTAVTFFEQEQVFMKTKHAEANVLQRLVDPLRNELCSAMNAFLRDFPAEKADLDASPDSLDSFLGLRERIQREDLPRHEQRFKERLNEKVIADFGLLNVADAARRDRAEDRAVESVARSARIPAGHLHAARAEAGL